MTQSRNTNTDITHIYRTAADTNKQNLKMFITIGINLRRNEWKN